VDGRPEEADGKCETAQSDDGSEAPSSFRTYWRYPVASLHLRRYPCLCRVFW
jgi:hypothetical protein